MKKDNLSKKLTYKESINRYDVEFIYKNKIRLLFMLPATLQRKITLKLY